MKKITLIICFSIVGLIGFAQQSESTIKITDLLDQENITTIEIENLDFNDYKDEILLNANDFGPINLEDNTHELTHNSSRSSNIESNYIEGAYTFSEYALHFDFKPNTTQTVKI
ncbi:MAG: hypothetical protein OEM04_12995 [Flavobacteriaceae bacterium]|nr:hypothetical protein [Flavobacteriaceae bacterium]